MLCKGFKVVAPKTFEIYYDDIVMKEDEALVKIEMGAICKADLRYYLGQREERILGLKYPMKLLHEVVGRVLKDPTNTYKVGEKVVLVPNITYCEDTCTHKCGLKGALGENYCPKAKFASSNIDGFSCEYVSFPLRNIVAVKEGTDEGSAVFAELTSVAVAAIRRLAEVTLVDFKAFDNKVIGVWGDGVVGYILTAVLTTITNSKVINIGKNIEKLEKFPSHKQYLISDKDISGENIDIVFECVGGKGSQSAINEIIETISIGGNIVLTGVSESNIEINTRKILEKGLTLTGSTRSSVEDFKKAVALIENEEFSSLLQPLIRETLEIKNISDYYDAFEKEAENASLGKNILKFHF